MVHSQLGLVVMVLLGLQLLNGLFRPAVDAARKRLWWRRCHFWAGRAGAVLGLVTVFLGLDRFQVLYGEGESESNGTIIAVWIGVVVLMFAALHAKNRRISSAIYGVGPVYDGPGVHVHT